MDNSENECVLCAQPTKIIGLGHCNHKLFCFSCVIKMRVISKIKSCPICKQEQDKIILTDNFDLNFQDFQLAKMSTLTQKDYKEFYYQSEDVRQSVENLNQLQCLVSNCKADKSIFSTIKQLKQHLQEFHYRHLCDTCLEQKTCFLSEQILYTDYQLRKHVNHGDTDEDGNLIFKHPYCKYCSKFFYDEDRFKTHLYQAHINCNLCEDKKYIFYKDHGSFERHMRHSHFMCEEPQCKDLMQVFKTQGELELHKQQLHCQDQRVRKLHNQMNMQQLAGFFDNDTKQQKKNTLNDQEGWDFSEQFVSLHKTNMRAIVCLDDHKDEAIDFREFYYKDYNDDYDRNCDYSEKDVKQATVYLEDIILYKPQNIPSISFDSFLRKCSHFNKDGDGLRKMINYLEQDKFAPENFVSDFLKKYGHKTGFRLLSFYQAMRDVRECKQRHKKVDEAILEQLKRVPRQSNNLIFNSKTYSELFSSFLDQLNQNVKNRIEKGLLLKIVDTQMPKERIFQLIEILRHVRTSEMGKLKFASNFGLQTDTLDLIRTKILLQDLTKVQESISEISNSELVPLYLYVNMCNKILKGEQVHKEKKDVNECVYLEYFSVNQQLWSKMQQPENGVVIPKPKKAKINNIQEQGIELDVSDFPTLPKPKFQQQQQQQQQLQQQQQQQQQQSWSKKNQKANSKWQEPTSVVISQGSKIQVDQLFPTMESVSKEQQPKQKQPQTNNYNLKFEVDETFEPLSNYMPQKSIEGTAWDDNPIIPKKNQQMKVIGEVVKKGKVKVRVSGGFF